MTKQTQAQWILAALKRRKSLTALDIFNGCGSICAAERIRDLRERGYHIVTTMRELPSGKRVGFYSLVKT